jgi:DNA repair photolyase
MGLNKSTGNMYKFIDFTWNTVKGKCPHDCSYCFCKRWGKQSELHFDAKEMKTDLGEGNFIFVGSSCDMFAGAIPTQWIIDTLEHCTKFNNRYLFQSKDPSGFGAIDCFAPKLSATLCTTIETNRWYPEIMRKSRPPEDRARAMAELSKYPRFVTIEPIMDFDLSPLVELIKRCEPVQVNIGADSGGNHLPEPSGEKVLALIDELQKFTTIARKTNLARLMK